MDDAATSVRANDRRVLLIGWDAADWRVARPLMEQGKMPALSRLVDGGVSGNLATLNPPLSPMLWTSIATGKRPFKHGIHGFMEPDPDGDGVRPITNLARKGKAFWNILTQLQKRSLVVGWWPSHPAEPINGVMVSNHYQRATAPKGDPWPMQDGTVHPADYTERLKEFRFHPSEIKAPHLLPFIPKLMEIDTAEDERVSMCARTIADVTSIHGAATALMQLETWDFAAVYYDGIDHFGHGFMRYHPPKQEQVSEEDFERYQHVIESAYRWHDQLLGALVALAGPETTIVLISDHGFHPDHLRPKRIPVEPAGPAAEHRHFGIFVAKGPGIAAGETVHGASVLDVCPTLLSLYGLPAGEDMDGKPLLTIFEDEAPSAERIPSWDDVPGDSGTHPPETRLNPQDDAEAVRQLVALGYVDEPDEDKAKARDECVRELRYNLAQAYADAGRHGEAARILEELWEKWPSEHRFGINYISRLGALGEVKPRREAIDKLTDRMRKFSLEARAELKKLQPELAKYRDKNEPDSQEINQPQPQRETSPDDLADLDEAALSLPAEVIAAATSPDEPAGLIDDQAENTDAGEQDSKDDAPAKMPRKLQFQVRKLAALASPRAPLLRWLRATQAMAEGNAEECLALLDKLQQLDRDQPGFHIQLAATYAKLGRWSDAVASYGNALRHDPENADAMLGRGEAKLSLGDADSAIDDALTATELVYQNPRAHTCLGKALRELGEFEHARRAFEIALAQAPGMIEPRRRLADLLEHDLGEVEEAAKQRKQMHNARQHAGWRQALQAAELREAAPMAWFSPTTGDDRGWPVAERGSVISVVSGLPRSGTSMMMQVLAAGGLAPLSDGQRAADSQNPRGYYEDERVKSLAKDGSWTADARGRSIKVVAPLLRSLPTGERYQVVFMERESEEVLQSQAKLIEHDGTSGAELAEEELASALARQVVAARAAIEGRPDIRVRYIRYDEAVSDPRGAAEQIAEFLGGSLDVDAMASAIDPTLHRNKAQPPS